jgi:hypothetical protein
MGYRGSVFDFNGTLLWEPACTTWPGIICAVNSGTLIHNEIANLEAITDFNPVDRSIFD